MKMVFMSLILLLSLGWQNQRSVLFLFLVRQRPSGSEAELSDAKRQKKEKESPSKQQHFTSSPPSTYAVNSPSYRYGKTKLSFRLYLICLVLCLSFL